MRVAIYSSPISAITKPTGVGQHVARMSEGLATADGVDALLLTGRKAYELAQPYLNDSLTIRHLPFGERWMRRLLLGTNIVGIERWAGAVDWVYCPKEQPVFTKKAKLAVTVHDVLAFEPKVMGLNRHRNKIARLRWHMIMRRILNRADLIITVSEFTRDRILELFNVRNEDRFVVVGNGVAPCYFQAEKTEDKEVMRQFGLSKSKYILTVGSLTYRKGGDLLLNMAERLEKERVPWRVVLTGRRHDLELVRRYEALKAASADFPLDLVGYVSNEVQAALYRSARVFLFPSRYEGFGIPILEAMAARTPVISSDAGALPEVAGDAAYFVQINNESEWLNQVFELIKSDDLQISPTDIGFERAREFTWQRCTDRLIQAMLLRS